MLASKLRDFLGLDRCEVVRSHGDEAAVRLQIGSAAAAMLSDTLKPDEVLGISWGRTLTATTSQLERLPRLTIVQLTGVVAGDLSSSPIEVARQASRRSGGDVYPIFAPLVVQDRDIARRLRDHPDIRAAIELFPKVTTALLSVGAWDPRTPRSRTSCRPKRSLERSRVAVWPTSPGYWSKMTVARLTPCSKKVASTSPTTNSATFLASSRSRAVPLRRKPSAPLPTPASSPNW